MYENAWEEVPMMMRQLAYVAYAAEDIMEYLETDIDPEEWFQNKLAHIHGQIQTLHAYVEGEKSMMSRMDYRMYGEAVEKETIKHPVGKRPSGIGWTLKSAGEQTGKDHSVWERKVKRVSSMKKEEAEQIDEISRDLATRAAQGFADKADKAHAKKDYAGFRKGEAGRKLAIAKLQGRAKVPAMARRVEEVELDESITKMSHGRLKFHLNTNTPHGSYNNGELKAERDRRLKAGEGEAYRKAKAGLSEVTQSAVKKTVTFTGSDGKAHTRNVPLKKIDRDEHGQEKIRESVELDEAFKVGMIKLNDGGSVILKKEDVDVLNSLFKSLSSTNRKKMESTAMKDKNGFNEILSFAREAM
jgi:hypothetical protein